MAESTWKLDGSAVAEGARRADAALVTPALLKQLKELLSAARYVDAHALATTVAEPRLWSGVKPQLAIARLAANTGAPRFSALRSLQAFRADRRDAEALYYAAIAVANSQGAWAALRFLDRFEPHVGPASLEVQADLWALRARQHSALRDFERAFEGLKRAQDARPNDPWMLVERAYALHTADRYDEALTTVHEALAARPRYRPAVLLASHLLCLREKSDEAEALLIDAATTVQAGAVWQQLADIYAERGSYAQASAAWERVGSLFLMAEPGITRWLAGVRARAAYLGGEREKSAVLATEAGGPFYGRMAERLAQPSVGGRVLLDVEFLRQHHMTCSPACLAMVSKWFGRGADQARIAAEICYDGTADWRERGWLDANGWLAREFSLTWDTARALIDRKVPFILQTQETSSSHVQVIVGYDADLGMLLVRDPYTKPIGEFLVEGLLEHYAANGPRCLVMVPADQAALLDGIELKDTALYDLRSKVRTALGGHDVGAAEAALAQARAAAAEHWLVPTMQLDIAHYSRNQSEVLALTETLYALNPLNKRYLHLRVATLRDCAKQSERVSMLEGIVRRRDCDPVFMLQLVEEWRTDRRRSEQAALLLDRARQRSSSEARVYWNLGELLRHGGDMPAAREAYRAAACLDDKSEFYAQAYVTSDLAIDGAGRDGLVFLRGRFERLHRLAGAGAITLHMALMRQNLDEEAHAVLERAVAARPDDGELLIYAAHAAARAGRRDEAAALMERAKGRVSELEALEARAQIADVFADEAASIALWQELAAKDATHLDARQNVAHRLSKREGRGAAIRYLEDEIAKAPHNRYLRQVLVDWLRETDSAALEAALIGLIEVWPSDPRAYRELAMYHAGHNRFAEAAEELARARTIAPNVCEQRQAEAYVARRQGDMATAREAYLASMKLDADDVFAFHQGLSVSAGPDERRLVCEAYFECLLGDGRGDAILAWQEAALSDMRHEEAVHRLQELVRRQPHWAQARLALVKQLAVEDAKGAYAVALAALERFPTSASLRIEAAKLAAKIDDLAGAERLLVTGLASIPGNRGFACELSKLLEEAGRVEEERAMLVRAVEASPNDAVLHAFLADASWRSGLKDAARSGVKATLRLNVDYDWAWERLGAWSAEDGDKDASVAFAEELLVSRRGDPRLWTRLGELLNERDDRDGALEAVERALAVDEEFYPAHVMRVRTLFETGKGAEAVAAVRSARLPLARHLAWAADLAREAADNGDDEAAAALSEFALGKEQHHFDALCVRAGVYERAGDWQSYLGCAGTLTRVYPKTAKAWGFLAHAQTATGDKAGAVASLRVSLALDRTYEYAALALFDLLLEVGDVGGAKEPLLVLKDILPGDPRTNGRAFSLGVAASDRDEAVAAFLATAALPNRGSESLEQIEAIAKVGWEKVALGALFERAEAVAAAQSLVERAVTVFCSRKAWKETLALLARKAAQGEPAREALGLAVGSTIHLAARAEKAGLVRKLVKTYAKIVREDDRAWALVGSAYEALGDHRAGARWYRDWRSRANPVGAWAQFNIATCLRATRRHAEANEINLACARSETRDHTYAAHAAYASLLTAAAGNLDEARRFFAAATDAELDSHDAYVKRLAAFVLDDAAAREAGATKPGWWKAFAKFDLANSEMLLSPIYAPLRQTMVTTLVRRDRGWRRLAAFVMFDVRGAIAALAVLVAVAFWVAALVR